LTDDEASQQQAVSACDGLYSRCCCRRPNRRATIHNEIGIHPKGRGARPGERGLLSCSAGCGLASRTLVRMQRDVLGSTFGDQRGADRHSPNLSAITSTGGRDMQRRWVRRGPFGLRTGGPRRMGHRAIWARICLMNDRALRTARNQHDNWKTIQKRPERQSWRKTQGSRRGKGTCPRTHRRGNQNACIDNDQSQVCTSGESVGCKFVARQRLW
jgi:hypothetical protein